MTTAVPFAPIMAFPRVIGACFVLGLSYVFYRLLSVGKRDSRLPPGPPTVPILGNVHLIPRAGIGLKFKEWAKQYGPIYSLKVFNSTMIVLSDPEIVANLVDKKGAIYAERPPNAVVNYLTDGHFFPFEKGQSWKLKRAIAVRYLSPQRLDSHHFRIQEAESALLMNNLLDYPEPIFEYLRLYTCSVVNTLVYGQRIKDLDSWWYQGFYKVMDGFSDLLEPGAVPPFDDFPVLWYTPGKWQSGLKQTRQDRHEHWTRARDTVDRRRAKGDKRDCLIDEQLDERDGKDWAYPEVAFNYLFGEIVEGGADTTAKQIFTILLALAKNPDCQKKAQMEIDRVCGMDRGPQFLDFDDLPYVNCIVKEAFRWRPTAPTGLPRMANQDDEYNGYLIPKGSTVFLGIWAIHHQEKHYVDHEKFNPDRYLNHPKLANEYASADWEARDK
ncbi:hypothetical protein N7462_000488 [Penicillium macrosclerotiorum]|uniref:uncharacterized protein n=1 Tax=Penicillium macrosclerotiorum TaxID=303699 RepID=UPI00254852DE|nr:uncharacterized protein N7462_000488 [Penicillium macrosclerotiorum]KAJ5698483.1 hypothetical protein N7462_000488 [Penicillium macrosclerotiorum]